MAADENRTITAVDPAWPPFDTRDARGDLASAYGGGHRWGEPGDDPRLAVVVEGAAAALPTALTLIPSTPEVAVAGAWATDHTAGEVVIDFVGYSLDDVSITVQQTPHKTAHVFESAQARDQARGGWFSRPHFRHQPKGSRVTVFLAPSQIGETVELHITGRDLLGSRRFTITLPGAPPEARQAEPEAGTAS